MPEYKKDRQKKMVWVKPELIRIPLNDQEALLNFCKGKPYDPKELKEGLEVKELTKRMLCPMGEQKQSE